MSEEENKKGEGFKVTDRRMAYDKDEPESSAGDETKATPEPEIKEEKPSGKEDTEKQERSSFQEINFATFILSLSGSAMFHIGEIPNPETGKTEKNLTVAKQTIDIIEILKDKTKGNLTSDEEKLLDNILYDLRMRFVNASKS